MDKIIKETGDGFPFKWANLDSYRDSEACRKEIYLKNPNKIVDGLMLMFSLLFRQSINNIIVYNKSWWDFCLDTWDFENDNYNYDLKGKSIETQEYLRVLIESHIQIGYSGCCICNNWDRFLKVILNCVVTHQAPYSPLFCDIRNNYFFYFHHTGSIGLYYKEENSIIKDILLKSLKEYTIED